MLSFAFNMIFVFLAAPCSAMAYHHDSRRIFVGQDNGAVMVGSFHPAFMPFVDGWNKEQRMPDCLALKSVEFSMDLRPENGLIFISA